MKDSNIGRVFYYEREGKRSYFKSIMYATSGCYWCEAIIDRGILGEDINYWSDCKYNNVELLEMGQKYVVWDLDECLEAKKVRNTKLARKMYADNILVEKDGYLIISE